MEASENQRNYGVDLLRICAIIGVIMLHLMTRGGVIDNAEFLSPNSSIGYLIISVGFCGVDCFALISGYVYSKTFKLKGLLNLWLQVIFYSIGITILFSVCSPGTVSITDWINAILPASRRFYWYFSAYFGMYLFIPILSFLIDSLHRRLLETTLVMAFFLFCFLERFGHMNAFSLESGHSTLWLSILYLCGGYIRKYYNQQIAEGKIRKKASICYMGVIGATWLSSLAIGGATSAILGKAAWATMLIADNSPTIVIASISLLIMFASVSVKESLHKVISFLAPCTFGVYLIHVHPLVWDNILNNCMINSLQLPTFAFITKVACYTIVIYVICFVIEKVRYVAFMQYRISDFSNNLSIGMSNYFEVKEHSHQENT